MAEYIEREAAFNAVLKLMPKVDGDGYCWIIRGDAAMAIDSVPSADVAPVRHGQWIWDEDGMDWNIGAWRCSECQAMSPMWWNTDKTSPMNKSGHRYCPNCGAKMAVEKT